MNLHLRVSQLVKIRSKEIPILHFWVLPHLIDFLIKWVLMIKSESKSHVIQEHSQCTQVKMTKEIGIDLKPSL
jgi:hypothetical protein